jgi:dedicator of cytokinesis protein 1
MQNINKMLRDLLIEHQNDPNLGLSQLTMKIQGVVDAAVNGGTTKYEEAFLVDDYSKMNPSDEPLVGKLKNLIADQIPILEVALCVHRAKVPADLLPLHDRLEECFMKMQAHVESKYGKRTTDLKFLGSDSSVILRKSILSTPHMNTDNRLSETSMGSSE